LFDEHKDQFPTYQFFKTVDEASTYLKQQNFKQFNILIKGSRGIKLENLVDCL
jgi:UDP-N-acetylmuramyl pentapeptide synthase